MPLMQIGYLRLAVLDASGIKTKTLYLPPPDINGFELEWAEKSNTWELDTGDERTRCLGYLPVLTCKWTVYPERPGGPYALGTAHNQRPLLEDLLYLLSMPTGSLRVSPGVSAGGFTVDRVQVKSIGRKGTIYTGLQITFRGRNVRPARDLEVF